MKLSQGQIAENRKSINQLIEDFNEIQNFSRTLAMDVQDLDNFVRLYAKFDRSLISDLHELESPDYVQHLNLQLNMLSLGHLSPSVIRPTDLRKDIESKITNQFKFPFDPKNDLWHLYKTLTCATLIKDERLVVVISIPLLDINGRFEMYSIYNLAINSEKINKSHGININMLAQYALETNNLAVNQKKTEYFILDPGDVNSCSHGLQDFCEIKSPIYSVETSKLCVIKLFMNDLMDLHKFCKITVMTNVILPNEQYLSDGQWAVAAQNPIRFYIDCKDTNNQR